MADIIIGNQNEGVIEQAKQIHMPDGSTKDVGIDPAVDVVINRHEFEQWVNEYNKMKKKVSIVGDMYAGVYDALRKELELLNRDNLTFFERAIKNRLEQVVEITDDIMKRQGYQGDVNSGCDRQEQGEAV